MVNRFRLGAFPPFKLLEKLGGVKELRTAAQTELQNRNPQTFGRWEAFLELYDGTGEIKNLEAPLREAFRGPRDFGYRRRAGQRTQQEGKGTESPKPTAASREDVAIEEWINGNGLDQTVAGQLRPLIFAAVADTIDWDMLGLAKTAFVGKTGRAFQSKQH